MSVELVAGLALALVSAALLNASFFFQHRATTGAEQMSLSRPLHALRLLATNPAWLVAYLGGWLGWGAYIAALRMAPLSIVQAIASGGLPLMALLAHRYGAGVTTRERVAAIGGALGIVLVCSSLGANLTSAKGNLAIVLIVLGVTIVVAGALAGLGTRLLQRGPALGLASGACYAAADVATKGALNGTGIILLPIFLGLSVLGFGAMQISFQAGGVLQTAGLSSLVTSFVPIGAGIALYHEHLPPGLAGWARATGFALSVFAAVLLGADAIGAAPDEVAKAEVE